MKQLRLVSRGVPAMAIRAMLLAAVVVPLAASSAFQQQPLPPRWITAWGTSQQTLGTTAITNATARLIGRVSIPGEAVRLDRKSTRLNSSHIQKSRMPSSA